MLASVEFVVQAIRNQTLDAAWLSIGTVIGLRRLAAGETSVATDQAQSARTPQGIPHLPTLSSGTRAQVSWVNSYSIVFDPRIMDSSLLLVIQLDLNGANCFN